MAARAVEEEKPRELVDSRFRKVQADAGLWDEGAASSSDEEFRDVHEQHEEYL